MADRITNAPVTNALRLYEDTLREHGLLDQDDALLLTTGSPTNGIPWSACVIERKGFIRRDKGVPGLASGRLGASAREAYERLDTLTRLLNDIEYLTRKK